MLPLDVERVSLGTGPNCGAGGVRFCPRRPQCLRNSTIGVASGGFQFRATWGGPSLGTSRSSLPGRKHHAPGGGCGPVGARPCAPAGVGSWGPCARGPCGRKPHTVGVGASPDSPLCLAAPALDELARSVGCVWGCTLVGRLGVAGCVRSHCVRLHHRPHRCTCAPAEKNVCALHSLFRSGAVRVPLASGASGTRTAPDRGIARASLWRRSGVARAPSEAHAWVKWIARDV